MQVARTLPKVLLVVVLLVCVACGAHSRVTRRVSAPVSYEVRPSSAAPSSSQSIDPRAFSPGACVAFSSSGPARRQTVFVDAGHGGRDPGAVGAAEGGRTITEAAQTLPVELDTMAILRSAGFRVVVSRTRDGSVLRLARDDVSGAALTVDGSHEDVLARAACANEARASVLVGIYFNAGAASNGGCLTAYDAVRPFAGDNLELARLMQAGVLAAMNAHGWSIPDQGVLSDVGLGSTINSTAHAYGHLSLLGPAYPGWVATPSRMPGALSEPLFITDPSEGSIAASRNGQEVIAHGLAKAVEQYFASQGARPA
jgi:N-acetylmuramoyl-L-alanine amidase